MCLLLEKDIDFTVQNNKNETALLCAVQERHENVVRELLKAGAEPATSITPGLEDEARRLLRAKIDANKWKKGFSVNRHGQAFKKPLHFAAEKGYDSIVRLLFDAGFDISCTMFNNRSALHCAAIGGHEIVFDTLSEAGINTSKTDSFGLTAHDYASTDLVMSQTLWRPVGSTVAEMMSSRDGNNPSTPIRPLTLSGRSMALVPRPLVSPLSSFLSAVVADSGVASPSARIVFNFRRGARRKEPRQSDIRITCRYCLPAPLNRCPVARTR